MISMAQGFIMCIVLFLGRDMDGRSINGLESLYIISWCETMQDSDCMTPESGYTELSKREHTPKTRRHQEVRNLENIHMFEYSLSY